MVGHIPLAGGPITRFVCTQHYSSDYLYAEHGAGEDITLIDVTKTATLVLAMSRMPRTAARKVSLPLPGPLPVRTEQGTPAAAPTPQTLRIMDFSDPQHPKIAREFTGVTAIGGDEKRGLVFVANSAGIWILRNTLPNPKVEAEYTRYVLYNP